MNRLTTHDDGVHGLHPQGPLLAAIAALVLAFRVTAWLTPSSFITIPPALALPTAGLGVLFLASGVWAWRASPSPVMRVFLIHAIGGAVHWGGTIGSDHSGFAIAWLVLYLAATVMGDAAFLDLALRYPRALFGRPIPTWPLYAVAVVALLCVPVAPFVPKPTVEAGLGIFFLLSFVMSLAGGIVFFVRWLRAKSPDRSRYGLSPIIASLIVTTAVDFMADGGLLPGNPEAWNLTYGLVPIVLAWTLVRAGRS